MHPCVCRPACYSTVAGQKLPIPESQDHSHHCGNNSSEASAIDQCEEQHNAKQRSRAGASAASGRQPQAGSRAGACHCHELHSHNAHGNGNSACICGQDRRSGECSSARTICCAAGYAW